MAENNTNELENGTPAEGSRTFGNDVPMDDAFAAFFNSSVAVIPGVKNEDDGDYLSYEDDEDYEEEVQEKGGLFSWFMRAIRRKEEEPEYEYANQDDSDRPRISAAEWDAIAKGRTVHISFEDEPDAKKKASGEHVKKAEEKQPGKEWKVREHQKEEVPEKQMPAQQDSDDALLKRILGELDEERNKAAEKAAAEKAAAEKAAAEKAAAEKAAAEKAAAEKAAAEKAAAEKAAAEKAAREEELFRQVEEELRLEKEKKAREAAEKAAAEKAAAEKAAAEKAAAEKAAAEKAAATRAAVERALAEMEQETKPEKPEKAEPSTTEILLDVLGDTSGAAAKTEPEKDTMSIPLEWAEAAASASSAEPATVEIPPINAEEEPAENTRRFDAVPAIGIDYEEEPKEDEETFEEEAPRKGLFARLHLFGRGKDEEEEDREEVFVDEAEQREEEPIATGEYEHPEEAEEIQADLNRGRGRYLLFAVLSGLVFLALAYLGMAARGGTLPMVDMIDPQLAPVPFLAVNLGLLVVAAAICHATMLNGIRGIAGMPSMDTLPMLAVFGALVQLVAFIARPTLYDPLHITVFAAPAVLTLCINALGKMLSMDTICRNFELITSGIDHVAAYRSEDEELTHHLCATLEEKEPRMLLGRTVELPTRFLSRSFSPHASEKRAQRLSWLLLAAGVAAMLVSLVMKNDTANTISTLAGTLAMGAPLAATLVPALPAALMHRSAARVGAVVPGWESVEELTNCNVLRLTGDDLFPTGCIHLHGIKTFEKQRIDLAILYATSILKESSKGLREVFMGIVQNDSSLLYKTESITREAGKGISGWIDHQRIIVGNREMMESHNIAIPSMDYENRYTKGQRSPVYLAVSGKLFGMFLLSYAPDPTVAAMVETLRAEGISLLVSSDDFCINTEAVENAYGLKPGEVKLLNNFERDQLEPAVAPAESGEACLIHLGSLASIVGGLRAAVSMKSGEAVAALVMTVSVAFSCVVSLALAASGGLANLVLPAFVLYQAAWCGVTLLLPALKKY